MQHFCEYVHYIEEIVHRFHQILNRVFLTQKIKESLL